MIARGRRTLLHARPHRVVLEEQSERSGLWVAWFCNIKRMRYPLVSTTGFDWLIWVIRWFNSETYYSGTSRNLCLVLFIRQIVGLRDLIHGNRLGRINLGLAIWGPLSHKVPHFTDLLVYALYHSWPVPWHKFKPWWWLRLLGSRSASLESKLSTRPEGWVAHGDIVIKVNFRGPLWPIKAVERAVKHWYRQCMSLWRDPVHV